MVFVFCALKSSFKESLSLYCPKASPPPFSSTSFLVSLYPYTVTFNSKAISNVRVDIWFVLRVFPSHRACFRKIIQRAQLRPLPDMMRCAGSLERGGFILHACLFVYLSCLKNVVQNLFPLLFVKHKIFLKLFLQRRTKFKGIIFHIHHEIKISH